MSLKMLSAPLREPRYRKSDSVTKSGEILHWFFDLSEEKVNLGYKVKEGKSRICHAYNIKIVIDAPNENSNICPIYMRRYGGKGEALPIILLINMIKVEL